MRTFTYWVVYIYVNIIKVWERMVNGLHSLADFVGNGIANTIHALAYGTAGGPPRGCQHREYDIVENYAYGVVAKLCLQCDKQLPPDFVSPILARHSGSILFPGSDWDVWTRPRQ